MVNQHLAGVHIAAACEAMALGMRAGADAASLYEVICNSAGMSWMFQNRVPHILEGRLHAAVQRQHLRQGSGHRARRGAQAGLPLPLAAAAHQLYLATAAAGHGNEDDAAVVKFYAALGIELPAKKACDDTMPRFANLSMMYGEHAFLDRFRGRGERRLRRRRVPVPYDFPAAEIAARLKGNGLQQALFNAPPGDWVAASAAWFACRGARTNSAPAS